MERTLLLKKFLTLPLRNFSLSSLCRGKRNFRCFPLYNFRGSREFREKHEELSKKDRDIPYYTYGVREPGYTKDNKFYLVSEMIPYLVVPDLTDFNNTAHFSVIDEKQWQDVHNRYVTLKPYVSYKASDVVQSEFTARDLFDAVYSVKVINDFKAGTLEENGDPKNPNDYEKLTKEEAVAQARKTGTDMF